MYTKTMYETPDEFFADVRGGKLPSDVYVVFEGSDEVFLSGKGADLVGLTSNIQQADMLQAAFRIIGIGLHVT